MTDAVVFRSKANHFQNFVAQSKTKQKAKTGLHFQSLKNVTREESFSGVTEF